MESDRSMNESFAHDPSVMGEGYRRIWNDAAQAEIDRGIELNRKADGSFRFRSAAGATVHIEQLDHAFCFGAHGFRIGRQPTEEINRRYEENFVRLFNQITAGFYWRVFEPEPGRLHFHTNPGDEERAFTSGERDRMTPREQYLASPFRSTDQFLEFAERHGLSIHGHPLVWQNFAWMTPYWIYEKYCPEDEKAFLNLPRKDPDDVTQMYAGDDWYLACKMRIKELREQYSEEEISARCPVYAANLKKLQAKRIAEILDYCGDRVGSWDVVNESVWDWREPGSVPCALQHGLVPSDYVIDAFRTAAEHAGKTVRLGINDNGNWERYAEEIRSLLRHGARVDLIGAQFHIFRDEQFLEHVAGKTDLGFPSASTPAAIKAQFDLLGGTGLPVHLSEITIPAPGGTELGRRQQAVAARDLYRCWFSQKSCLGITWWHTIDGAASMGGSENNFSGVMDTDGFPKPVYHALCDLIHREWHTALDVRADKDGTVSFRGFRGRYRLSWTDASGSAREETVVLV